MKQNRSAPVVDTSRSPHARLRPVPANAVTLSDTFWEPRRKINRTVTLPSQYRHLEETGRLDNFRRASGKKTGIPFQGIYFNDSDVYKWLEAAAWTLATHDDPALAAMVDAVVTEIEVAQQADGYLNTYYMLERAEQRWSNLRDMHELYCAGHFLQAAVAHHRATGDDRLLNVACCLADCICGVFGPEEEGKRAQSDGHEEIEMALVELYRVTGDAKYLRQAQFFIDVRGRGAISGSSYHQDHKPFRELDEMIGHAVRMVYLDCGAADVCLETGEAALKAAMERQWDNMIRRRIYVTGGLGARYEGEAFGKDYELPNERAYTETCAAIGSVMWNHRMLAIASEARYADLIEHTLYNAVLPGLSLDGQAYFYQNPLRDDGKHRRQPWFGCACCPPNVARLLASLPGYFYGVDDQGIYAHLYAEGTAQITLPEGRTVGLTQHTRYPWEGDVRLTVEGEGVFSLFLRIPAWCGEGSAAAALEVAGEPSGVTLTPGTYAEVRRAWTPGDTIHLRLPMPVRRIECHPCVAENAGHVALQRGPIVYCVEQADNLGVDVHDLALPADAELRPEWRADLLGGVVTLRGTAQTAPPDTAWEGRLYRTVGAPAFSTPGNSVSLTAIPYYAWANRESGPMQVWIRNR